MEESTRATYFGACNEIHFAATMKSSTLVSSSRRAEKKSTDRQEKDCTKVRFGLTCT
jgi:hypothetical protein